ncbi:hypothetical protein [Streptomyces europaeiscabiei]|uniref:hypothetical protein n=1 Tax=Streptomyces europaeiscabiei TaxID=146819 RepID=UPI0029AD13D3|nr:hypothetical protein [Streptomyces europaeiscabiei]MDX3585958.1 hypothetical protein [Streptomyces europaeiscabiei]
MDYPYIEVQARNSDGARASAFVRFTSGDLPVTEADLVAAVTERLTAVPGVTSVTATLHHIAETPL